jgi:hypothetical protein
MKLICTVICVTNTSEMEECGYIYRLLPPNEMKGFSIELYSAMRNNLLLGLQSFLLL